MQFLALVLIIASQLAQASVGDRAGLWRGNGEIYDAQGNLTVRYEIFLNSHLIAEGVLQNDSTSVSSSGAVTHSSSVARDTQANHFEIVSDLGSGVGLCMRDECQSTLTGGGSVKMSATDTRISPRHWKALLTATQNDAVLYYYREEYVRIVP
jgi:hypothetical protein